MPKPDNTVYTRLLSSLKSEISKIQTRGFPDYGDYSVDEWAEIWGVSPETIRSWVKEHKIEVWGPSDKNYFINSADFKSVFKKRTIVGHGEKT